MPYASAEKQKERNKRYYEENREELKRKRREKYRLQKNNGWAIILDEMPVGLII